MELLVLIIQMSLCCLVLLLKLCQKHTATTEDSIFIHLLASPEHQESKTVVLKLFHVCGPPIEKIRQGPP